NKFTITPGLRVEFLNNTIAGYKTDSIYKIPADGNKNRYFLLSGIGFEYKTGNNTSIYANFSQAYRPIDYSQLEPFGITSRIDPNLKDQKGFNADLGYRGIVKNYLNFDLSLFYLAYNNRIGVLLQRDSSGALYSVRTNIANSVHKGMESYIEFNLLKFLNEKSKCGLSVFNSFAYIDARYTDGPYKGNRVEAAAKTIERIGLSVSSKNLSATFQVNSIGDAYGDASNVKLSTDPIAGYIPAYTVLDFSSTYKFQNFALKFGVNNMADKAYFTRRTDEYPGPGIIPAIGRSIYIGFTAKF
ncbi:MAG: TonB-dependent receptor, partial [Bacteroidota bacterium]|nr:TonB-dependent receptor [Bacteroidota bacterium]